VCLNLQVDQRLLKIFGNKIRVEILRLLLNREMASLSDILHALKHGCGFDLTISGIFKHIKILENAGLIHHESGGITLQEPDARKTVYLLQGKERVEKIIKLVEKITELVECGLVFKKAAEAARKIQGIGPGYRKERKNLKSWLKRLEKKEIMENLTEDEIEKIKLWKILIKYTK